MADSVVRTRFAPSPTGALHLGNVRIAVFNWLFARRHEGSFVLRVEDTDVVRNVEGAEEALMEDLRWLGLDWDEGPDVGGPYGPYEQSRRLDRYQDAATRLLDSGHAYRCYCTDEELAQEVRDISGGQVLRYSGRCRTLSPEEIQGFQARGRVPLVRLALPHLKEVEVTDEIRGVIRFPHSDLTDFILQRRDGRPTYNFAVVVDDAHMEISHVIRGAGHLSNTPKQVLLYRAFGWKAPRFAHLPTVLGGDGGKLSKRTGAAAVTELRRQGYHPAGIVNYLSLLGWSHPEQREVLTRSELATSMDLDRVGASDTTLDPEKLRWMSGQHLARLSDEALTRELSSRVDRSRYDISGGQLALAVDALRSRMQTLEEINEHLALIFPEEGPELEAVRRKVAREPDNRLLLEAVLGRLSEVEEWSAPALEGEVRSAGEDVGVRGRKLFHPLRKALTGVESGPDLGKVLACIGRGEAMGRIRSTLALADDQDGAV